MGKKAKSQAEEEPEFHVEVLLAARLPEELDEHRTVQWVDTEYLVKWYKYDKEEDNTWEPHDNIVGTCERLLTSFWNEVGQDNDDYLPGYICRPSKKWIDKEKKIFLRVLRSDDTSGTKLTREEEEKFLAGGKFERGKRSSSKAKKPKYVAVVKNEPWYSSASVLKRKRKESTSASDSDIPLSKKFAKTTLKKESSSRGKLDTQTEPSVNESEAALLFHSDPPELAGTSTSSHRPKLQVNTSGVSSSNATSSRPLAAGGSLKGTPTIPSHPTPTIPSATTIPPVKSPTIPQGPPAAKLPAHRQPARVKVMSYSEVSGGESSQVFGNSTKQKIAASFKANSLPANLSFKKRKGDGAGPSSGGSTPTSATLFSAFPGAHTRTPTIPSSSPSIVAGPSNKSFPSVAPTSEIPDVNNFLDSVMQDDILGHSSLNFDDNMSLPNGMSRAEKAPLKLPRIQKHFKWEGNVSYPDQTGSLQDCGRVVISELNIPHPDGIRLDQAFPGKMKILQFSSLYHTSDILRLLPSFKSYCRLAALKANDVTAKTRVDSFASYIAKHSLVTMRPIEPDFEKNVSAFLIFFHPHSVLASKLSAPSLSSDILLLVALFSRTESTPILPLISSIKSAQSTSPFSNKSHDASFHQAISLFKFPEWLHKYLTRPNHEFVYCIWYNDLLPFSRPEEDQETKLLRSVLKEYPTIDGLYKQDVSIVFVHVTCLKSLHKLPGFLERTLKQVNVAYVTYGTAHRGLPPSFWSKGMKHIYFAGGMVTFTPSVLMTDPMSIFKKCMMIVRHEFWVVRVIPVVLGMIARLHCKDQDPLAVLDRDEFPFDFVLDAIHDRKFSFRSVAGPQPEKMAFDEAVAVAGGRRNILDYALHAFDARFANIPSSEYLTGVYEFIDEDVFSSQMHPDFMEDYRRFVVLGTEEEVQKQRSESFEWKTPSSFELSYKSKSN